jgi:WD40 repeat protein
MTGQVITEFETIHDKGIRRIAVWEHGAESLIITGSSDSALRIFDFNGHLVRELLGNFGRVQSFIVSHEEYDGDFLVIAAGEDRSIKVWGLRDGELKFTCFGHTNEIVGLAFCVGYSSKSVIASLDKSGEIRFWDRKNGNCLRKLG